MLSQVFVYAQEGGGPVLVLSLVLLQDTRGPDSGPVWERGTPDLVSGNPKQAMPR